MCKWNSTAIQSNAKGEKEREIILFFVVDLLVYCWQAGHIVPAIERLKRKGKKKEDKNFEKS